MHGLDLVGSNGEKGSDEGLAVFPKIDGSPRGWESHLLQVLHPLNSASLD